MNTIDHISLTRMSEKSTEAAAFLRALSNGPRLLVLCHLAAAGELSVGALVERIGISQSAMSQHLSKLRQEGLVEFRRDAQTLYYRVGDANALAVLEVLQRIYCPELTEPAG